MATKTKNKRVRGFQHGSKVIPAKRVRLYIEAEVPVEANMHDIRAFVQSALASWGGSLTPDESPTFYGMRVSIADIKVTC